MDVILSPAGRRIFHFICKLPYLKSFTEVGRGFRGSVSPRGYGPWAHSKSRLSRLYSHGGESLRQTPSSLSPIRNHCFRNNLVQQHNLGLFLMALWKWRMGEYFPAQNIL